MFNVVKKANNEWKENSKTDQQTSNEIIQI